MKNKQVLDILNTDVIHEVEKISNKHWSEFDHDENMKSIGLQIMMNERKRYALKETGDTHWGMDWNQFKSLLEIHGFKEGYSEVYEYNKYEGSTEEVILYYHPEKNLVIWSQSYSNMTSINSGSLYGHYKTELNGYEAFNGVRCSHGYNQETQVYYFDIDVREGLFTKLYTLESDGEFVEADWSDRFLWFLKLDEDSKEVPYKILTQQKIDQANEECRKILNK